MDVPPRQQQQQKKTEFEKQIDIACELCEIKNIKDKNEKLRKLHSLLTQYPKHPFIIQLMHMLTDEINKEKKQLLERLMGEYDTQNKIYPPYDEMMEQIYNNYFKGGRKSSRRKRSHKNKTHKNKNHRKKLSNKNHRIKKQNK